MVSVATMSDKAGIRKLWEMCFDDSPAFVDWFFKYRYIPEYTAVYKENGEVLSAMQSMPARLYVRGESVPCAIVAGVSTHKEHQGKGLMKQMFVYFMQLMRQQGIVLTPHTPVNLPTFFSRGHFPVTDTRYMTFAQKNTHVENVYEIDLHGDVCNIFDCYRKNSVKYSGMMERSLADFRLKCEDYASDGARCFAHIEGESVLSYAIFYETEREYYAEEYLGERDSVIYAMLNTKAATVKMPVNYTVNIDCVKNEVKPQGACGVANAAELLRLVGKNAPYAVEITDGTVPQNEGIYDFGGNKTDKQPAIKLSAGRLTQWLCGYKSLEELEDLIIYDEQAAQHLNELFPKLDCYIIDMY